MLYRKLKSSDIPQITELYNCIVNGVESFETEPLTGEQMRRRAEAIAAEYPYYVAEDEGGRVAGYCYAHPWKERAAYSHTLETTIYLDPAFKRSGTGTALMRLLIADCRRLGCKALIACITGDNAASIAFHRKLGFEQASLFRSVGYKHGRWLDVVDMEMIL